MMINNGWPKKCKMAATAIGIFLVAFAIIDEQSYNTQYLDGRRSLKAGTKLDLEVAKSAAKVDQQAQNDLIKEAEAAIRHGRVAFRVIPRNGNDDDPLFPNEILIEVINPHPEHTYSVTVVSPNRYTGTAMLKPKLEPHQRKRSGSVYSWKPTLPGNYEVLVHEIDPKQFNKPTPLIQPSYPIGISERDSGSGLAVTRLEDRIKNSPPCQTLNKVDLYSRWDGDWLGPEFQLSESIRTGWSFVPSHEMGCKLETFSTELIQAVPEKKSILIMGSSVERGIFLSLVDMMLNMDEKKKLFNSEMNKCWGRMSVTKGNLKVMYQDFRANVLEDPSKPRAIQCHNDKLAHDGSSYLGNATLNWEGIFQHQTEQDWPSVIYLHAALESMSGIELMFDAHVRSFVERLPTSWQGTLVLGDYQFEARSGGFLDDLQYQEYKQTIHSLVKSLNDPRVRWVDGNGISKEMRLYSQQHGEELSIGESQHFHTVILENSPELLDENSEPVLIRSNITEMMGQLLLGHAFGPKHEYIEHVKRGNAPPNSRLRWCHACPKCLLPFSIDPHPQMECHGGPLTEKEWSPHVKDCGTIRKNGVFVNGKKVYLPSDPRMCPKSCLQTPVMHSFGSESDTVDVRECPIIS